MLAFAAYALLARDILFQQSIAPHFVYLAAAWLAGQSNLIEPLPAYYDLIWYEGRWYVAQQPLPALLMLPGVAWRGAAGVPDVLLTVLIGAGGVALCYLTLRLAVPALPPPRRALLTLLYALGTPHAYMSALATVWLSGQVAAAAFLWVFLLGLLRGLPWLAGLGLGAAILARPGIAPGGLLIAALWLFWHKRQQFGAAVALFALPILLAVAFLGWYNHARFGSYTDFGYAHIQEAENLAARRLEHGNFSPAFLPENLYTATLRPPLLQNGNPQPDPWGMGLLLTAPALLYGLAARWDREKTLLALGAGAMLLPALLYHNTGSTQFGYRFILDCLPVWMVLVAFGAQRGKLWLLAGLVAYGVLVHLWGFAWMYGVFYP